MSEHDEQVQLFNWAAWQALEWPELDALFAIPNGGLRNKVTAAKMKAEGVKKGVPDLFLPVPRDQYHGLFLEMKFGRNRCTAEQQQWLADLSRRGYRTAVCYGAEEARCVLADYLGYDYSPLG